MTKWTDSLLDRMRKTGDTLADTTTRAIFEGKNQEERNAEIHKVVKHHHINMNNLPPALKSYFETLDDQHFTDEDIKAFDRSCEIFEEHGYRIFLLLFFKSLPTGYMCPKPGTVLVETNMLVEQATRRVFETAIYIMSVMRKGWYKGDKTGLRMLEKLRFLHSSMRVQIVDDKDWDVETMGVPINQEDQVLTLQLFSLAVIRGLHEMGILLSKDDQKAWFHAWRRIGRILGIEQELEPKDMKEAWRLQRKICDRQFYVSVPYQNAGAKMDIRYDNSAGKKLTSALLDVMVRLSGEHIEHNSLERITRYFLYETAGVRAGLRYRWKHIRKGNLTAGMRLNYVSDALGMNTKPDWLETLFDPIIYWLVNWGIWDVLFSHHKGPSFFTRMINKILAKRLGLSKYNEVSGAGSTTGFVLDGMVKGMLKELNSDHQGFHHRPFDLDDHLYDKWDLDDWDY